MSLTLAQLQALEAVNPAAQAAGLAQGLIDIQTDADAAVAGTVPAGSIGMAELADIATKTVIGRTAGGTGVPSAIAIATTLKADLSLDNVDNTSNATERAATATLTNKTLGTVKMDSAAFVGDGAVTFTKSLALLTKAGVGAYTLAAPGAGDDGLVLTIMNTNANAHVVTTVNLINDGVTGSPQDTLTFAAFAGASVTLVAYNQLWHVMANNNVTIAGA